METEVKKKNTTRKKPCPKGTRANKKGECVPIKIKTVAAPASFVATLTAPASAPASPVLAFVEAASALAPSATLTAAPIATLTGPIVAAPIATPSVPTPSVPAAVKETKKPCPKGTRRNKKTGLCEPNKIKPTVALTAAPALTASAAPAASAAAPAAALTAAPPIEEDL